MLELLILMGRALTLACRGQRSTGPGEYGAAAPTQPETDDQTPASSNGTGPFLANDSSAPPSAYSPSSSPSRTVNTWPPVRRDASRTVTSCPRRTSSQAQLSPAIPAPATMTRLDLEPDCGSSTVAASFSASRRVSVCAGPFGRGMETFRCPVILLRTARQGESVRSTAPGFAATGGDRRSDCRCCVIVPPVI
jgi:hypothetical protein